nr:hypothetical protein [uncultured Sphingomonas sp.]
MKALGWHRRIAAFACSSALIGSIAWACADGGYETGFEPTDSVGVLSPGNDTRTNFVLLMADRNGTKVADPAQLTQAIVPFDMPYPVFETRLSPPRKDGDRDGYIDRKSAWGLSADSDYDWRSGNLGLCHSNKSGAADLAAALNADRSVPTAEKQQLLAARDAFGTACDKAGDASVDLTAITSPSGRAYASYINGARLFYAENFGEAATRFAAITGSAPTWLADAAAYMRFRTALAAAAHANFDQYGSMREPAERNADAIRVAEQARRDYLNAYPNGRYAASARALSRRTAWLSNNRTALGIAYSEMVKRDVREEGNLPNLAAMDEIDIKLLPSNEGAGVSDPALLAVIDLMRLRPTEEYDKERTSNGALLTRADLERQKPVFARDPDLYGFLLAAEAFYSRNQPREVLSLIPDAAHQQRFSYLQFSRQMLRGFALEAAKDRNARAFWLSLLAGATQPYQRAAIELAIYQHDRDAGAVGRLFETGSPILHPLIRQEAIEEDAGPQLLRQQASAGATQQQRDVALYLLLGNELHHGMYRQFLADQAMVGTRGDKDGNYGWSVSSYDPTWSTELRAPRLQDYATSSQTGSGCASILPTVQALADNAKAVRPQLCLAEFLRVKDYDSWNERWSSKDMEMKRGARNHFPGTPLTRSAIYRAVLADPSATADDRAFALNRSIRCYAPSNYSSCGDNEPQSVRKAWFEELKRKYPGSSWAKDLKYYW